MEQYISKSALVAEIERRVEDNKKEIERASHKNLEDYFEGYEDALVLFKEKFINTLEVKEVDEEPASKDLEEASKKWLRPQLDKSYANYGEAKMMELTHFDGYAMLDAIEFGAKWQKEQILGDDNKQYHRLRHETLKRLYENETKLELMLDNALEGYIEKYEQIGGHNYLSLKIPMLSKPDDCKDGDKIKLIILKEE